MNQNFVTSVQAAQLFTLGYGEPCLATIDQTEYVHINGTKESPRGSMFYNTIDCPTNQDVIDWAIKVHGLYASMVPEFYGNGVNINWQIMWATNISSESLDPKPNGTYWYGDNGEYPTYHTVLIAMIDKLIELIQYKNLNGEFQDPRGIHVRRGV
jgi:hypothetical protein